MKKYEYQELKLNDCDDIKAIKRLNLFGDDGWRAIKITRINGYYRYAILERVSIVHE